MKMTELRIGNLLNRTDYANGKQPRPVTILSDGGDKLEEHDWSSPTWSLRCAEPIPLTEEWLLKLGFTKRGEYSYANQREFQITDDFDVYLGDWCVRVEHVHQLQNLYFALTGEEL